MTLKRGGIWKPLCPVHDVVPRPKSSGVKSTHLRRPKMKAWKRLRLLLSGASLLTWLYRVPMECGQEPEVTMAAVSQVQALLP